VPKNGFLLYDHMPIKYVIFDSGNKRLLNVCFAFHEVAYAVGPVRIFYFCTV